ncbi:terminase family protein [Pigmentiphaga sp. GD03639]|uniref:terminase large subunit domain-containing protein n=1 Tax=Pigmentiphaga sp. GD03639 TaxID=2975354 RepID=UPI00244B3BF2|nr:terminase family protein [Pigmentiphaga sp. GD03639]MDH2239079.1 terminase family protein [Pigmentiphaga sp. GD03639]
MSSLQLSQREAAAELLARRRARAGLLEFTQYTNPYYEAAPHHRLIAAALERVERGETDRLMICMPPRHGKSELASRRFPAWYLGRNPERQVIAASYNGDIASDFGRDVRNIVIEPAYGALFATRLSPDSRAANRWHTSNGGMYVAAGVGTAITGRGAHLLLIDDPFKDRKEADSETARNDVWDWYTSTAYTRLMPGGAIVLINTRWHDDDLSGRLLAQQEAGGDKWEVLSLPAIDQTGNALWPERYDIDRLLQIKAVLPERDWTALYQQQPAPDDGTYFQRDWFKFWERRPAHLSVYGTSDYAVTDGGGDYTVHRIWGVDPAGDLYRLGGWRGQTASDAWIERQLDLVQQFKPLAWFGEAGVIQKAVEPMLRRRMIERNAYCRLEWLPSIVDKPTRARGFQARASMGRVWLEPGAEIAEFLRFPAGKNDDDVDCASLIGRALDEMHPAIVPVREQKKHVDRWDRAFNETDDDDESWKVR